MTEDLIRDIDAWIDANKEDAIGTLRKLIRIKSVKEDPVTTADGEVYPFGQGVQDAFSYVLTRAEEDGFEVKDVDHYGGHIDYIPASKDEADEADASSGEADEADASSGEADDADASRAEDAGAPGAAGKDSGHALAGTVGVIGHLDTVPEGDGWKHEPFSADVTRDEAGEETVDGSEPGHGAKSEPGAKPEPRAGAEYEAGEEKLGAGSGLASGYIWGRGTTDDKGPLLASYFAMKALKDTVNGPGKRIRLILGLDEETDWEGLWHYFRTEKCPETGFSPDAYFPVVKGEKGIMSFKVAGKLARTTLKGLELRKFSGGTAVNMVPDHARAVVNDPDPKMYDRIREQIDAYESTTGHKLNCRKMGKSFEISADGRSAHGSTPEQGINAISILAGFLGQLNFVNEGISNFFDFYNDALGADTTGKGLGVAMEDAESGALSMNVGIAEYDRNAIGVKVDIRYPVTKTSDEVYDLMMPKVDEYGLGVLKEEDRAPICFDEGSKLIKICMECYQKVSGDTKTKPNVMGGGTYARACPGFVAYGGLFPDDPDLMHQKDEKIEISRYLDMIKVYALALYELTS